MKYYTVILTLSFVLFLSAPQAQEIALGAGYNCEGVNITNKSGALLSEDSAESEIKRKLRKKRVFRKRTRSNGNRKRVRRISKTIRTLKSVLKEIPKCISGQLLENANRVLDDVINNIIGSYNQGNYELSNLPRGPLLGEFSHQEGTLKGTLTFDSIVEAIAGSKELKFEFNTSNLDFPFNTTVASSSLGEIEINLQSDLSLSITANNIPNGQITRVVWDGVLSETRGFIGRIEAFKGDALVFDGTLCVLR